MSLKEITPDDMLARVLYRDGLMLVIDKPAGLAVHRGPKGGASLEDYFDALRFGLPRPPALAHRLDKDTSGCLVLGRHRKALAHLGLLFKHGKVGKTYWAVVEGGPEADAGTIDLALGRLDATRGWWMKPDPKGLPSLTEWKVLGRSAEALAQSEGATSERLCYAPHPGRACARPGAGACEEGLGGVVREGDAAVKHSHAPPPQPSPARGEGELRKSSSANHGFAWLALTPVTGRTHQLRVHCAASGWPIVGDNIYGNAPRFTGPILHLHAREVVVPISKNKPPVVVTAPVPAHMRDALAACGWKGDALADVRQDRA